MRVLLDSKEVAKTIEVVALQILDKEVPVDRLVLVGITTRGAVLAGRISELLKKDFGKKPRVGQVDINLYRDDLSRLSYHPVVKKTEIPFSLDGTEVFLIDDVLYTGRTIRCALNALFDFGRPDLIHLAVLIDRGGRELPIQADIVGLHEKIKSNENVVVKLTEVDGEDGVTVE